MAINPAGTLTINKKFMIETNQKLKIWGLEIEPIYSDITIWKLGINQPFKMMKDGQLRSYVGIGAKIISEAKRQGVDKFLIEKKWETPPKESYFMIDVPTEKDIKYKIKNGEYEDRESKFGSDAPKMRIYYFLINI